jgi:FkbM family methyltransferase
MLRHLFEGLPSTWKHGIRRQRYKHQIRSGSFESPEKEFTHIKNLIKPGDWVLDIGANVGHYTLEFARLVGREGRVLAFEPMPETFALLSANMITSRHNNITLINAAVSDHCWLAGFEMPDNNPYQAHISDDGETKVLCIEPTALISDQRIAFVKIDAEGHEPQIVQALAQLIDRDRPTLMVECNTEFLSLWATKERYRFNDLPDSHNHILEPLPQPSH